MKVILVAFAKVNEGVVQVANSHTAVFGLLKRNGKVDTIVIKDTKTDMLIPIIASKIKPDGIILTVTEVIMPLMWVILNTFVSITRQSL